MLMRSPETGLRCRFNIMAMLMRTYICSAVMTTLGGLLSQPD